MTPGTAVIDARGVSKSYGTGDRPVVGPCDVQVRTGEVLAVVGPSGSGKTTLIQILAGLVIPDTGVTTLFGRPLRRPSARIAVVFQDYGLFPWRTALRNVSYPLEVAGVPRRVRNDRARAALDLVGLASAADKYPHQLSGGMAQRTAIARALIGDPAVLLLDEPMSALDVVIKQALQQQIRALLHGLGLAALVVTHDLNDAARLADRVVVLAGRPGRIVAEHRMAAGESTEAQVGRLRRVLQVAVEEETGWVRR
jgi:NitT/TauT family transport system ATP-binding protein